METPTTTLTECVHTTRHTTLLIPFHTSGPGFPVPSRASTAMLPHCSVEAIGQRRVPVGLFVGERTAVAGARRRESRHSQFLTVNTRHDTTAWPSHGRFTFLSFMTTLLTHPTSLTLPQRS